MCMICVDMAGQFRRTEFLPEDMSMGRNAGELRAWGDSPLFFLDLDQRGGGYDPNGKPSLLPGDAGTQITRMNLSWATGLGQAATVTYAYRSNAPGTMPSDTSGFSRFTEAQINATELMLAAWADVAQLTFVRSGAGTSGEGAYADNATMLFGNYSSGAAGAGAFAYLPGNAATNSVSGDVWVNFSQAANATPTYLGYGYQTILHEVGHAIGLSHPADYNAGSGGSITYSANALYYEDSRQYTVMSYFPEGNTGGAFSGRFASAPLLDDIAAVQRLYGANMSTRTGDTVYGFNSTAGRIWYDATQGGVISAVVFAVWDAGGIDTLDFSGYSQGGLVDLRQGHFSSVGGLTGNVSIAMGAVIENAIGGSGNDTLVGNSANNRLRGNAGNDTIEGGVGSDTAVYAGNSSEYTVTAGTETVNGQVYRIVTVTGPDGTDTLRNVEFIAFSNITIAAPVAAAGIALEGDVTNDTINGTEFNDWLFGAGGDDTIDGGFGNDLINGGLGNDTLNGWVGFDTVDYSGSVSGVNVNLSTGTATGGGGNDSLSLFESVIGSRFNDTLTGDAGGNTLNGNGGIDTLSGGEGDDILIAGNGTATSPPAPDVVKAQGTANTSFGTAVTIDPNFDLVDEPGFTNPGTVPHAKITATSNGGGKEYYAFTVGANVTATFDINDGSFDTVIEIFDANGTRIAINDDGGGDGTNSFLSQNFAAGGTYYIAVSRWVSGSGNSIVMDSPPAGSTYGLNISIPGHAVAGQTFAGSTLNGDTGSDTLHSGSGDDTMNGGSGTDTVVYTGARALYVITDLGGGSFRVTGPDGTGTDILNGIERIQFSDQTITIAAAPPTEFNGTSDADYLTGTEENDILRGFAGDDRLHGYGGDDILYGGDGADVLNGWGGTDTAWYENGVPGGQLVIDLANPGSNTGEAAGDTYTSIERVVGSNGADIIRGTAASEVFQGRGGDDTFLGRGGGDQFDGGDGVDTVWYEGQAVVDLRDYSVENAGAAAGDQYTSIERVVGSNFNDVIRGTSAAEFFTGRGGNDFFVGRGGGDWFDGGDGVDSVYYDFASTIDLQYWNLNAGGAAGDRYDSIEAAYGSNSADIIRGTAGTDYLYGRGGDDAFDGRGGGDLFDGGSGLDTVFFSQIPVGGVLIIDLLGQVAQTGSAAGNVYISIERVVGTAGIDVLFGTSGADLFVGGAGNDEFVGRGGGDWFEGGDGIDTIWYETSTSGVSVIDLSDWTRNSGVAAGDHLVSVERVMGSAGSDEIRGTAAAETLMGRDGNDFIYGGGGADFIDGGSGFDRAYFNAPSTINFQNIHNVEEVYGSTGDDLFLGTSAAEVMVGRLGNDVFVGNGGGDLMLGEGGFDSVWYEGGAITLDLGINSRNAGGALNDRLIDVEQVFGSHSADSLYASNLFDSWLNGRGGSDYIEGRDRNDHINGGFGSDTLFGGLGSDAFIYGSSAEGGDTILDFASGVDKIQLDAPGFNITTLPSNWFVAGTQATAANAQLIWNAANRTLSFDADGTGSGAAVVLATFGGSANLTQSDIAWTGLSGAAPKQDAPLVLPSVDDGLVFTGKDGDALVLPGAPKDADMLPLVLPALEDGAGKIMWDEPLVSFDWDAIAASKPFEPIVRPGVDTDGTWDEPWVQPPVVDDASFSVGLELVVRDHPHSARPWITDEDRTDMVRDDWLWL